MHKFQKNSEKQAYKAVRFLVYGTKFSNHCSNRL